MSMQAKPIYLDLAETEWILSLTPADITMTFLRDNFAPLDNKPAKKSFLAYFKLPANKLGNKETITTTVGIYIFNLVVLRDIIDKVGYYNETLKKSKIEDLINTLSFMLLENKITVQQYKDVYNRMGWLGYGTVVFTAPPFSDEDLVCPPKTAALREKLFKQYSEELQNNNIVVCNMIEKELVASAEKELREQGSGLMEIFDSGSRGKFANNYKNMVLMRGVVPVLGKPGEYEVGLSNLVDGTSADEQSLGANILVEAASGRALETASAGYLSKQLTSAFQGVEVDERGSDCGTKMTLRVKITKDNAKDYMYSYIVENGKLILLDFETIKKYYDKEVNWRTPLYCRSKKYCNHCYGELPYLLGETEDGKNLNVTNVGITFNGIGEKIKNFALKAFHDMTVNLTELKLDKIVEE